MLVSEDILYLELPKTACSHIRNLLRHFIGGKFDGKHNRPSPELLDQVFRHEKMVVGSVRNPWDWYISIWAYGCDSKGVLFDRLTSRKLKGNGLISGAKSIPPIVFLTFLAQNIFKPVGNWKRLYADSKDPDLFREWLSLVLALDSNNKYSFGDGYPFSPVSSVAGLYTYYYVRLFSHDITRIRSGTIKTMSELCEIDRSNNILNEVVRIENLEDDMVRILQKLGHADSPELRDEIRTYRPPLFKDSKTKSNSSSRVKDIEYYYNEQASRLVANSEKLIIEKYNYQPPFT